MATYEVLFVYAYPSYKEVPVIPDLVESWIYPNSRLNVIYFHKIKFSLAQRQMYEIKGEN